MLPGSYPQAIVTEKGFAAASKTRKRGRLSSKREAHLEGFSKQRLGSGELPSNDDLHRPATVFVLVSGRALFQATHENKELMAKAVVLARLASGGK